MIGRLSGEKGKGNNKQIKIWGKGGGFINSNEKKRVICFLFEDCVIVTNSQAPHLNRLFLFVNFSLVNSTIPLY